jgi:hypothetical protein
LLRNYKNEIGKFLVKDVGKQLNWSVEAPFITILRTIMAIDGRRLPCIKEGTLNIN